jgi:hypothetical protein
VPEDRLPFGVPGKDPLGVRGDEPLGTEVSADREKPVFRVIDGRKQDPVAETIDRHVP